MASAKERSLRGKGSGAYDDDDKHCQPCFLIGSTTPAESFCVNCKESLCTICAAHHQVLTATKDHVHVKANEANTATLAAAKDKCSKKCSELTSTRDDEGEPFNHLQYVLDKNEDRESTLTLADDMEAGAVGTVAREAKIKHLRGECERMLGEDEFQAAYDYLKTARYQRATEATEEDTMQGLPDSVRNPSDYFLIDQLLFLEEQHHGIGSGGGGGV